MHRAPCVVCQGFPSTRQAPRLHLATRSRDARPSPALLRPQPPLLFLHLKKATKQTTACEYGPPVPVLMPQSLFEVRVFCFATIITHKTRPPRKAGSHPTPGRQLDRGWGRTTQIDHLPRRRLPTYDTPLACQPTASFTDVQDGPNWRTQALPASHAPLSPHTHTTQALARVFIAAPA